MKKSISVMAFLLILSADLTAHKMDPVTGSHMDTIQEPMSGAMARRALSQVGFLVGSWEGEGWSLTRTGDQRNFWVKEYYKYRGDKDLMDMEGHFGNISHAGERMPDNEYGLGILYYDESIHEYRMWHYTNSGEFFDIKMNVELSNREMYYLVDYPDGGRGKFHLIVGDDGVWISTFEIELPDKSWLQVMEFRMKRFEGQQ